MTPATPSVSAALPVNPNIKIPNSIDTPTGTPTDISTGGISTETQNDTQAEKLDILYRDEHYIVVNKPSGLLVHRSMIDRHETRFALQILRDQINQHVFPLHRLDKPTSGALIFALSAEAARDFNTQTQTPHKEYLAITRGYAPAEIFVDHPLSVQLDKICDNKARTNKPPQLAQTRFKCLATTCIDTDFDRYPQSRYSLVACFPTTGRKHQIRRHLKHISHPIIGDAKHGKGIHNRYFKEHLNAGRLLLHAVQINFKHPYSQREIDVIAPLDACFQQLIERFQWVDKISPSRYYDKNREEQYFEAR